MFEKQGQLWAGWTTTAPFRAQQGQIRLYKDSFPGNPDERIVWTSWDDVGQTNPANTNQLWGSDWVAAWVAQSSPNGPYVYVVKSAPTAE